MTARTILLVDDSDAVRFTFGALLEEDGHRVLDASTLAQARAHLTTPIEIAILDLHLADGHGTELVPDIRQHHPTAAIILMTGDTISRSMGGVDLILDKDFRPDEVVLAAEPVLAARGASTSSRPGDKLER